MTHNVKNIKHTCLYTLYARIYTNIRNNMATNHIVNINQH